MRKLFLAITVTILFFSCVQGTGKTGTEVIKEGNKLTMVSTDTAKLSKLIDIATHKPMHVKFKYVFFDNSGKDKRVTIPGPSDYYLQAVLQFDSSTFKNLEDKYYNVDYLPPYYDRQTFKFDWLDNDTRQELLKTDTSYHGTPGFFFGKSTKLWVLKNKILLVDGTN